MRKSWDIFRLNWCVEFEVHLQTKSGVPVRYYQVNDFQSQAEGGNTASNKTCRFLDEGKNTVNELMER
jgi:hypothetical protein